MTEAQLHQAVTIVVPGDPVAKTRAKTGNGNFYTPKKTVGWEALAAHEASIVMAGRRPLRAPVAARVVAYFTVPKSWPAWKREAALEGKVWHTATPDADNILKAALDALKGIVIADDSYVATKAVSKEYAESPRVEITIVPLAGAPSNVANEAEYLQIRANQHTAAIMTAHQHREAG